MGWTGGETPQDAVRILASLGIPTVSVVSGGKISHVRTEHVWVEAYVPYQYYRGAGPMKGQKIWVPLDPSFKQHEKIEGLDLSSIIDIDTEASIEGFKDGIIVSSIFYYIYTFEFFVRFFMCFNLSFPCFQINTGNKMLFFCRHASQLHSMLSIPLPENAISIELPDLLSTFFLFQKSLQNP
jgi:hypothetical protein